MAGTRICVFQVLSLRSALVCSRPFSSNPPGAIESLGQKSSDELMKEHVPRHTNYWKVKQQRYRKHITDLVRKSRQDEAVKLLEQMIKGRVRPDEVTYNTILSGYAKQGNIKMAFKTFNEVKLGWGEVKFGIDRVFPLFFR